MAPKGPQTTVRRATTGLSGPASTTWPRPTGLALGNRSGARHDRGPAEAGAPDYLAAAWGRGRR
jgi:hypothetical protein